MSTREIADRTKKDHFHVMRDFREMCEGLGVDASKFGGYYFASNGKENPCFNLPKRECMILVSGYSIPLRAAMNPVEARGGLLSFEDTLVNPQNNQRYPIFPILQRRAGRPAMRRNSTAMPSKTSAGTSRMLRASSAMGISTAWITAGLALASCRRR